MAYAYSISEPSLFGSSLANETLTAAYESLYEQHVLCQNRLGVSKFPLKEAHAIFRYNRFVPNAQQESYVTRYVSQGAHRPLVKKTCVSGTSDSTSVSWVFFADTE